MKTIVKAHILRKWLTIDIASVLKKSLKSFVFVSSKKVIYCLAGARNVNIYIQYDVL